VFMGAIVIPAYLVPALTLTLALGLSAETRSATKLDRPAEAEAGKEKLRGRPRQPGPPARARPANPAQQAQSRPARG
jgi:hypothetical protein